MLREMAKLAGGMLLLHGHLMDVETLRWLGRDAVSPHVRTSGRGPRVRSPRARGRSWRVLLETLMLVPLWIATPLLVLATISELVRSA